MAEASKVNGQASGNAKQVKRAYERPITSIEVGRHDTERGMNPATKAKVLAVENSIRNNINESSHIINDNGEETMVVRGVGNQVVIPNSKWAEYKAKATNNIITHNHPRSIGKTGIRSFGNSFSRQDIALAVNADAREMRAVTPRYTFSIKRPAGGWGMTPKQATQLFVQAKGNISRQDIPYLDRNNWDQTSLDRAEATVADRVNKEFVRLAKKKLGVNLIYSHKRG